MPATGYIGREGAYRAVEPLWFHVAPAGAMTTTASDMARFLLAHLEGGAPILRSSTLKTMHSRQFGYHPQMAGTAYGFREYLRNGQRLLWHTGTTQGFGSILFLIPEHRFGIFVALNRAVSFPDLRGELMDELVDRWFPASAAPAIQPPADFAARAGQYAGLYWAVEKPQRTLDKLEVVMADGLMRIVATDRGTLETRSFWGARTGEYAEVEPLLFRQVDGSRLLSFRQESAGRITHAFSDLEALRKVGWLQNPTLSLAAGAFALLLLLTTVLLWPFLRKRRWAGAPGSTAALVSLLGLVFATGVGVVVGTKGTLLLMFGLPQS